MKIFALGRSVESSVLIKKGNQADRLRSAFCFVKGVEELVLITGGERSGKSSYALKLASSMGRKKAFIATAVAFDEEMNERIVRHRQERDKTFETIEEPIYIEEALRKTSNYDVRLIECMTTWMGNIIHKGLNVNKRVNAFLNELKGNEVIVTNEVGMGIIPMRVETRRYVEALGRLNQKLANIASEVYMMVCGIAVKIK